MRELFILGNRVHVGGHFATIRFIGELAGQNGTWYGIEWDDPSKGKHRGEYNGVSYFTVTNPKNTASFVREKHLNRGIGAFEAIEDRYMKVGKVDDQPEIIHFSKVGCKDIEFYHHRKNDHFEKSTVDKAWNLIQTDLDLSTYPVSYFDANYTDLPMLFPRINCLNISKTLIEDLDIIFQILSGLPNVSMFNMSCNQFRLKQINLPEKTVFPRLRKYSCDAVNLTFEDFVNITDFFPNLKVASFAMNTVSTLFAPQNGSLLKLEELALQQNYVSNWSEIQKLSALPSLKLLNLLENKFKTIELPEPPNTGFESLEMLILVDNEIETWPAVSRLFYLKKLSKLVLYNNPVCEIRVERFRDEIIARLPKLEVMNKTEVSKEERKSASILYVKMYYEDWVKAGGPRSCAEMSSVDRSFLELHPTYATLFKDLGDCISLTNQNNEKIKSQLIQVNVVTRKPKSGKDVSAEVNVRQIKILSSMTISKIKLLMTRLLKVPPSKHMDLFYRPHQHPNCEYSLDCDLKTLSYFSVEDSDILIVQI